MKPTILIPTYDNERTLEDVVRGAAAHGDVLVVDDGSRDATPRILAALREELPGVTVLTHERNQGKGRALMTGLEHARESGYTHAITIDSDGQHLTEDIPAFLAAARRSPDALWLGARDLEAAGAGRGSRFGRWFSNFWTFVETGHRLPDTQTGFRCYPLAHISAIDLGTTGYDFEVEVLVKASWSGVVLDSVPIDVRYFSGEERVSHMRPVLDFLRIGWLNTKLCTLRCCFPAPYLAVHVQRRFQELSLAERMKQACVELFVKEPGSPRRIAASVGLGLFMGIAPFWGLQIALTIVMSHLLGASKAIAVAASNISFPLMIPPILYTSLVLGRLTFGDERAVTAVLSVDDIAARDFWPFVVGSFILAAIVAATGATFTLLVAGGWAKLRNRNSTA